MKPNSFCNRLPLVAFLAFLFALPACRTAPVSTDAPAADASLPMPSDGAPPADLVISPAPATATSRLYILRWNPDVSSFTDATFREGFTRLHNGGKALTNWSLYDWDGVRPGDWALFVRVGGADPATDGIAGLCRFASPAYESASWRGDGTTAHYADIEMLLFNNPTLTGLFTAAELDKIAPSVDWHGGPSGIQLDVAEAELLALHLADRLARAAPAAAAYPPDAFAVANRNGDGLRTLVCNLLSRLCPVLRQRLFARQPATRALDEPWQPEPRDSVLYDPALLPSAAHVADIARPVGWDSGTPSPDEAASDLYTDALEFTPGDARFADALLRAAAPAGENAVVTPVGTEALLEALSFGACGETAEVLSGLFGGHRACADRLLRNAALLEEPAAPPASLDVTRTLLLRDGLAPDPAFVDLCDRTLGLPVQTTPMTDDARQRINRQTADATGGRVPGIIPAPLDPDTPLLLLQTLGLQAAWDTPFDPADTQPSLFHAPGGDIQIPFMNRFGRLRCSQLPGNGWTAVSLPYSGRDLELVLYLPPRGATPRDLRDGLAEVLAGEWKAVDDPVPVFLTLPKFTVTTTTATLAPALATLDAGIACSEDADFTGIVPDVPLSLGPVHQTVLFSIDEQGTDAPSATLSLPSPPDPAPKPRRILVNRPFAFAVRAVPDGALLFLGQVFTPAP